MSISIIIPTYNRSKLIPRALKSALTQMRPADELLIVDDCSADDTAAVVEPHLCNRVRYIRHDRNRGGGAARNTGIQYARNELIAFLDSDDEWLPGKLEKQLLLLNQLGGGHAFLSCGVELVQDPSAAHIRSVVPLKRKYSFGDLLASNFIGTTSTILVRRPALLGIDGFDESLRSCQDWDLYLRLAKHQSFDVVPQVLVRHYLSGTTNRISNDADAVIQGHERIRKKFAAELRAAPRAVRASHYWHMSNVFFEKRMLGRCLTDLCRAFLVSLDPRFVYRIGKRTWQFAGGSFWRRDAASNRRAGG